MHTSLRTWLQSQALHRKAVEETSRLNALDEVRIASAKWHEVCPQVRPRQCERALRACAGIRMMTRAFSFYVRRAVARVSVRTCICAHKGACTLTSPPRQPTKCLTTSISLNLHNSALIRLLVELQV